MSSLELREPMELASETGLSLTADAILEVGGRCYLCVRFLTARVRRGEEEKGNRSRARLNYIFRLPAARGVRAWGLRPEA